MIHLKPLFFFLLSFISPPLLEFTSGSQSAAHLVASGLFPFWYSTLEHSSLSILFTSSSSFFSHLDAYFVSD